MANTLTKLDTITVGAGGAATIEFTNIPQTYTDLVLKYSLRGSTTAGNQTAYVQFNTDTGATYSGKYLYGDGTAAYSGSSSSYNFIGSANDAGSTANTFNNGELYIPNYVGATQKSSSADIVRENNATSTYATTTMYANLWANTAPITSLKLFIFAGNFVQYSSVTLYGVFKEDVSVAPAVPTIGTATGGNASASVAFTPVSGAASYTATSTPGGFTGTAATTPVTVSGLTNGTSYTFTVKANNPIGSSGQSAASNSVTPVAPVAPSTVEYLVVAGGGGSDKSGGGGAGGYRTASGFAVSTGTALTVTVGAGGNNTQGSNSVFSTITSVGGGKGNGGNGGSGGGQYYNGGSGVGTGTAGQGNNGGNGGAGSWGGGGGGGGAGAAGTNASGDGTSYPPGGVSGGGGVGLQSSISGTATYYAGGGGGAGDGGGSSGGNGGGGAGRNATSGTDGTANTGGGAGACTSSTNNSGGSGIVIIRYADTYANAASTTGSPTFTNTGGYKIYKWTGSGSITF